MQRATNSLLEEEQGGKTCSVGYQATFSRQCGPSARTDNRLMKQNIKSRNKLMNIWTLDI